MKAIRQRVCCLVAVVSLGLMTSIIIFIRQIIVSGVKTEVLLAVVILATVFLAGFLIREFKRLKVAELIIENQIMDIKLVIFEDDTCDKTSVALPNGGIEVIISCFGILLDSRIIKFNQDGIRLKNVEIGPKFIYLTYGTDRWMQKTRILHAAIDSRGLESIKKIFRYETGIVPVITD